MLQVKIKLKIKKGWSRKDDQERMKGKDQITLISDDLYLKRENYFFPRRKGTRVTYDRERWF